MVEGGHEGPIEGDYDLVSNVIALALEFLNLLLAPRKARRISECLFKLLVSDFTSDALATRSL